MRSKILKFKILHKIETKEHIYWGVLYSREIVLNRVGTMGFQASFGPTIIIMGYYPIRPKCKPTTTLYKSRASQLSESLVYTLDRCKTCQTNYILKYFIKFSKSAPFMTFFFLFQPAPSQYKSCQNLTVTSSSQ